MDWSGYLHIEDGWVKGLAADRKVPIGDRDKVIRRGGLLREHLENHREIVNQM